MSAHPDPPHFPKDLEKICDRVRGKSESYEQYNFSRRHNDFLKAFFDLAQEFDSLDDFYRICVAVPSVMLNIDCALYLCSEQDEKLMLICSSKQGVLTSPEPAPFPVQLYSTPYEMAGSYIIPICSKQPVPVKEISRLQEGERRQPSLWGNLRGLCRGGQVLGMYEVCCRETLSLSNKFFFVKYVNRIGYNLYNRLIAIQNINHLKFINNLVVDIEHNIIVPNMYFKHLFNQLKKKIRKLETLKQELQQSKSDQYIMNKYELCCNMITDLEQDLLQNHREIVKHHSNTTLFLESLFRREHFERGHLVLHPRRCFVEKEVIEPQLEHYASRLKVANVSVDRPKNMLQEEFQIFVDIGLLAQVYANLFSNAAKYAKEIMDHQGNPRKAMAYGREIVDDFPVSGKKGIKFNVFTTGPSMSKEHGNSLFLEGRRGEDSEGVPGTGHGLSFIHHVIEMHGGSVGYEPTPEGNNFYFILPMPPLDFPPALISAPK